MSNDRRTITPPVSILDSRFNYVPSHKSDIRERFTRIRREQEKAKQPSAVVPIKRKEAR